MTQSPNKPIGFTTQIQFNDETGEYFIQFPEEFMAAVGWQEGDTVVWTYHADSKQFTIHRKDESRG